MSSFSGKVGVFFRPASSSLASSSTKTKSPRSKSRTSKEDKVGSLALKIHPPDVEPLSSKPRRIQLPKSVVSIFDHSELAKKEIRAAFDLYSGNRELINQFFGGFKVSNEDLETLGKKLFLVYWNQFEVDFPVEDTAVIELVAFLKEHEELQKLDFAVVAGNIKFLGLPILIEAIKKDELPHIKQLTFSPHQINRDMGLFQNLSSLESARSLIINIRLIDDGQGSKIEFNISNISFEALKRFL